MSDRLTFFYYSFAMASYYEVLKISQNATNAEIKSAYRRLARKLHPDVNNASENTSAEFAKIAKAYEVLGNPPTRADYDKKLLREQFSRTSASVLNSENQHAKRWRQMAYDRRYNEIIDRMIADERRETLALQKIIFPLVALFVSTGFVAALKPMVWAKSAIVGKTVLLALFIAGCVHLYKRLRTAFERYTYRDENLHDSILEDSEPVRKPFSRASAIGFLVFGFLTSFGVGLFIGNSIGAVSLHSMPALFGASLRPEFVFYPPIFVLFVDLLHAFATRMDY